MLFEKFLQFFLLFYGHCMSQPTGLCHLFWRLFIFMCTGYHSTFRDCFQPDLNMGWLELSQAREIDTGFFLTESTQSIQGKYQETSPAFFECILRGGIQHQFPRCSITPASLLLTWAEIYSQGVVLAHISKFVLGHLWQWNRWDFPAGSKNTKDAHPQDPVSSGAWFCFNWHYHRIPWQPQHS